jgi:ketosteroid isomerase-like protein
VAENNLFGRRIRLLLPRYRKETTVFLKRAFIGLLLAVISAAGISCTHPSRPFAPSSLTAAGKSCYDAINTAHAQEEAAVSRKDINAAMAECSLDYVVTSPDGRTANYAQTRQSMVSLSEMSSEMKETNAIRDLRLTGDTAVVLVKNHVEATLRFPNPMTGKPMIRAQDHLDRETWVKGPQGWLLTKSEILSSQ